MRSHIIFSLFADSHLHAVSNRNILRYNSLIQFAAFSDHRVIHDDGIPDDGSLSDDHAAADHGIINLSGNLTSLAHDAPLDQAFRSNVLRREDLALRVDLPVFLIQIELRHDVNQLHIGFPVGIQGSHILPVAVKFIRIHRGAIFMAVGDDMFSEIQVGLFRPGNQSLLQRLPVKYVDTHGCQIASGIRRLLLKIRNLSVLVRDHDAEPLRFLHRYGHNRDRTLCASLLMVIQHHFIIHLIDVITGENQNIIRIEALHIVDILINCIGCSRIPFAVLAPLVRGKDSHTADIPVQIPRNADPNMGIQPKRLILGEHPDRIHTGVDTVAQREINNPVLSAERYCRLRNL